MKRKEFIQSLAFLPFLSGSSMKLNALNQLASTLPDTEEFPVLFIGHGSPMNAIEENVFSTEMKKLGKQLPKPRAILMVSAHWETKGTQVTAQEFPPTIHDFGGFPKALFDTQYPAPGSKWLAHEAQQNIHSASVQLNDSWGFDHGCWSITRNMYPEANIPIVQLSLDYTKPPAYHYHLGKELNTLRKKGVLIIGSGNMVHNLGMVELKGNDFNQPYGFDWALEANEKFKTHIQNKNFEALVNYSKLGKAIDLAIPTPEHYLPLLYILGSSGKQDKLSFFNDVAIGGSLTMTSVLFTP